MGLLDKLFGRKENKNKETVITLEDTYEHDNTTEFSGIESSIESKLGEMLNTIMPDGGSIYLDDRKQAFYWHTQQPFPQYDHTTEFHVRWYASMSIMANEDSNWMEAWAGFHHTLAGYLYLGMDEEIPDVLWQLGRAHAGLAQYQLAFLYLEGGRKLAEQYGKNELVSHINSELVSKVPYTVILQWNNELAGRLFLDQAAPDEPSHQSSILDETTNRQEIQRIIADEGLRPLGNKQRLTHTDDQYNVRLFLFGDKSDAETYYQMFIDYAEIFPPPFPIEIMFVRIHTIYDEPFGLVFPYERTDTRPEYAEWFRETILTCNEGLRNYRATDHSYEKLNQYVNELFDWTILVPELFDLNSEEAQAIFNDPPGGGYTTLTVN